MRLTACATLRSTPENAVWYRAILTAFFNSAFNFAHTRRAPSRFNAGSMLAPVDQFATLYFAKDPVTAQFEVGAVLGNLVPGGYVPHPRLAHTMLTVKIALRNVVDLTDPMSAHAPLATTIQELTGDWQGYRTRSASTSVPQPTGFAPTQELGRAIYKTGVEGFRAVSARLPFNKTLVVFPDNLQSGSSLSYADTVSGDVVHEIRR